jgi:hypothetical protein
MNLKSVSVFGFVLIFLFSTFAFGSVIEVTAGTDKISAAYETASPGDVLELVTDGGIYKETSVLRTEKDIIIRGAEGLSEKPIWQCKFGSHYDGSDRFGDETMEASAIENYTNSDLHLSNLVITGLQGGKMPDDSLDYTYTAIYMASLPTDTLENKYELVVDNVDFHFFYDEPDDTDGNTIQFRDVVTERASLVKFTNCTFYDGGRAMKIDIGNDFLGHPWDNMVIENCTFGKLIKDHPIIITSSPDSLNEPPTTINHCTFVGSGDDCIKMKNMFNIKVENSVFFDIGDNILSDWADNSTYFYNNVYSEWEGVVISENITILDSANNVETYPFADTPANVRAVAGTEADFYPLEQYDFTLSEEAAATLIGNDGKVVGDQRWVPDVEGSIEHKVQKPGIFKLSQNYPNPFNPTTTIEYTIPAREMVKVTIYNLVGQEVEQLVNEVKNAGIHKVNWNATNMTTGVYFYRITAGNNVQTKKMLLVK